jgi:hypothetical protein
MALLRQGEANPGSRPHAGLEDFALRFQVVARDHGENNRELYLVRSIDVIRSPQPMGLLHPGGMRNMGESGPSTSLERRTSDSSTCP